MSIFDVSKYILKKCGPMSTWKLQKLYYYSQAWTLAWGEKPLFDEDFQAWANGPVCPELFFAYKGMFIVNAKNAKGNADVLSAEQKENTDIVLKTYGVDYPHPRTIEKETSCGRRKTTTGGYLYSKTVHI